MPHFSKEILYKIILHFSPDKAKLGEDFFFGGKREETNFKRKGLGNLGKGQMFLSWILRKCRFRKNLIVAQPMEKNEVITLRLILPSLQKIQVHNPI